MQQRGLRQGNCINRHASGVRFSIRYWLPLIPTLHNKLAGIARSYCAIGLRSGEKSSSVLLSLLFSIMLSGCMGYVPGQ